jgi:hypothetical protein
MVLKTAFDAYKLEASTTISELRQEIEALKQSIDELHPTN